MAKLRVVDGVAGVVDTEAEPYLFDPWTVTGEYSRDDYFLRSTDNHGHSTTVRICIPTHYGVDMDRLVSASQTPYRTREDICRDGLYHVLHYRNETLLHDPLLADSLMLEARRCRYQTLLSRAIEEQQLVEDAKATIKALSSMKSTLLEQAFELVEEDAPHVDGKARKALEDLLKRK